MFQDQSEILAFEFTIFLQKRANNMGQHEKDSQRKWSKNIGWTFAPWKTNILYDNLIGGKITRMNDHMRWKILAKIFLNTYLGKIHIIHWCVHYGFLWINCFCAEFLYCSFFLWKFYIFDGKKKKFCIRLIVHKG